MFANIRQAAFVQSADALSRASSTILKFSESLHYAKNAPEPEEFPKPCKNVLLRGEKTSGRELSKRKRIEFESDEDARGVLVKGRAKLQKRLKSSFRYERREYRDRAARQPDFKRKKPVLKVIPLPSFAVQPTTTLPVKSTPMLTPTPTPSPTLIRSLLSASEGTPTLPPPPSKELTQTLPLATSPQPQQTSAVDSTSNALPLGTLLSPIKPLSTNPKPTKLRNTSRPKKISNDKIAKSYTLRIAKLREDRVALKTLAKKYHETEQTYLKQSEKHWIHSIQMANLIRKANALVEKHNEVWRHEQQTIHYATMGGSPELHALRGGYKLCKQELESVRILQVEALKNSREAMGRRKVLKKAVEKGYKNNAKLVVESHKDESILAGTDETPIPFIFTEHPKSPLSQCEFSSSTTSEDQATREQ